MLDEIWIVDAPEEMRLERLVGRGMDRDDALRRIENQRGECNAERFPEKPVRILENAGCMSCLQKEIEAFLPA
jgi:dephospho-CoA kinase